jgi:diguanylate cyclase (GGDEF)-like protein
MAAGVGAREAERLEALAALSILDTPPEREYDDLTRLAAAICGVPIALVGLIDDHRQWYKAKVGIEATEVPRDLSFCRRTIQSGEPLIVPDTTLDERFHDHPMVVGEPHLRFYAGIPLTTPEELSLGTLCVADMTPRVLSADQLDALNILARQATSLLLLRRETLRARAAEAELRANEEQLFQYQLSLEEANARLRTSASTDALTGVRNRLAFDERLAEEFERAARYGHPLSLLMLDIDHFKHVNDTLGHSEGDAVLRRVARVLSETARTSDLVARYGGEEFALILPETDVACAVVMAERCRKAIASHKWDLRAVTLSAGVATTSLSTPSPDSLTRQADEALYEAKRSGRNCVRHHRAAEGSVASPALHAAVA